MHFNTSKILFFILIFNLMGNYLHAQNKNTAIIGNIIDSETGKPVSYVHILNYTNNRGTISDSLGVFKLAVKKGDNSIKITSIGYYTITKTVNLDSLIIPITIYMKQRVYEIMQVDIYPFTKEEFKHQFVYKDIPKDSITLIKDMLKTKYNSIQVLRDLTPKRQIPLNFKTSVEKQEILLAKIKDYTILKTKNLELMKRVTGLNEEDVYDFDRYCRFSFKMLKEAPEYYIIRQIQKKYKEYKELPKQEENSW